MNPSDWISLAALLISVASIGTSYHLYYKDRGRIRAQAILNHGEPGTGLPPVLEIHVVNIGRRPILLTWILIEFEHTGRRGSQFGPSFPFKLDEGEPFELKISPTEPFLFDDELNYAINILIQDSLGATYPVKDARKLLLEYQRIHKLDIDAFRIA